METTTLIRLFLFLLGASSLLGLLAFAVVSLREREPRAARVAFGLAFLTSAPFFAALALPEELRAVIALLILVLGGLAIGVFFLPLGSRHTAGGVPGRRVDERDTMFARYRLEVDTPDYEAYYAMRPERQAGDDELRALPGLLSEDASLADPRVFASARDAFARAEAMREAVNGPVASQRQPWSADEASAELSALALRAGAVDVGVTELRPYHVYSHVGRGTGVYGDPITLDHGFALAFTVEMDHAAMRHAPQAPVVMESAKQYVAAAEIAVEIAALIRSKGYAARAHIDGNYRVIAPLVARDAGLGEIGRMGILLTPRLGPRVRLGVVTCELPLGGDATPSIDSARSAHAQAVIDFCSVCRKCAEVCPSHAIPSGERAPIDDTGLRWELDPEACFRLWNRIGTDCGRCMSVCPFSHPDSVSHNVARWAIRRSGVARRVLLRLDDLFYGRHPSPLPPISERTKRKPPRPGANGQV